MWSIEEKTYPKTVEGQKNLMCIFFKKITTPDKTWGKNDILFCSIPSSAQWAQYIYLISW